MCAFSRSLLGFSNLKAAVEVEVFSDLCSPLSMLLIASVELSLTMPDDLLNALCTLNENGDAADDKPDFGDATVLLAVAAAEFFSCFLLLDSVEPSWLHVLSFS